MKLSQLCLAHDRPTKTSRSILSLKAAKSRAKVEHRVEHEGNRPPPEWVEAVLEAHNQRRALHWTAPLIWSDECYFFARAQANDCMVAAKKLRPGHVDCLSGMHGQCSLGPQKEKALLHFSAANAEKCLVRWYDEEAGAYDFSNPGPQPEASNFTQVIWAGTTSVGMALSTDGRFCVANYFPRGNTHPMDFAKFVLPPHEDLPPWQPEASIEVPEAEELMGVCSGENWQRHEETTAALVAAMRRRPCDGD